MSAIGSIAGGLISGLGSFFGGEQTNEAAQSNQQEAEQFSDHESSTMYQRGTADMRAAGLNPILAAGSPDSAPTIGAAPVVNSLSDAMNAGISNFSALQSARQADAQVDNIAAQANLNKALSVKAAADTTSALANARNTDANTNATRSSPFISKFIGSDAAKSGSDFLSSAVDSVSSKMKDIVDGITSNSAKAVFNPKRFLSPIGLPPGASDPFLSN